MATRSDRMVVKKKFGGVWKMIRILENLRIVKEEEIYDALLDVGLSSKTYGTDKGVILDTRPFDVAEWSELKVISRVGVGLDNIDLEECKKRGVKVYTTPCRELTDAVVEFTIKLILDLMRSNAKGRNLSSMTVGVIGCGRIGERLAFSLIVFGCEVFMYDVKNCFDRDLERLFERSDIVSIHVSGNDCVVGDKELLKMKIGSYLVNTARGGCIDETAVSRALRDGKLAGFASDVNHDFLVRSFDPNVILTPHIASSTVEARTAMERMAVSNLVKGLKECLES